MRALSVSLDVDVMMRFAMRRPTVTLAAWSIRNGFLGLDSTAGIIVALLVAAVSSIATLILAAMGIGLEPARRWLSAMLVALVVLCVVVIECIRFERAM